MERSVERVLRAPMEKRTPEQVALLLDFFGAESFFDQLSLAGLRRQACLEMCLQRMEAGAMLCTQDEPADRFVVLMRGAIRVVKDGRTVGRLQPGDCLGEESLTGPDGTTWQQSAMCEQDCRMCVVSKESYMRIFRIQELEGWIKRFWELMVVEGKQIFPTRRPQVCSELYTNLHLRISKTIAPTFSRKLAEKVAIGDWKEDYARATQIAGAAPEAEPEPEPEPEPETKRNRRGKAGAKKKKKPPRDASTDSARKTEALNNKQFADALFQLVDVWCEEVDSMELYCQFLRMVYSNVSTVLTGGGVGLTKEEYAQKKATGAMEPIAEGANSLRDGLGRRVKLKHMDHVHGMHDKMEEMRENITGRWRLEEEAHLLKRDKAYAAIAEGESAIVANTVTRTKSKMRGAGLMVNMNAFCAKRAAASFNEQTSLESACGRAWGADELSALSEEFGDEELFDDHIIAADMGSPTVRGAAPGRSPGPSPRDRSAQTASTQDDSAKELHWALNSLEQQEAREHAGRLSLPRIGNGDGESAGIVKLAPPGPGMDRPRAEATAETTRGRARHARKDKNMHWLFELIDTIKERLARLKPPEYVSLPTNCHDAEWLSSAYRWPGVEIGFERSAALMDAAGHWCVPQRNTGKSRHQVTGAVCQRDLRDPGSY